MGYMARLSQLYYMAQSHCKMVKEKRKTEVKNYKIISFEENLA